MSCTVTVNDPVATFPPGSAVVVQLTVVAASGNTVPEAGVQVIALGASGWPLSVALTV